MLKGGGGIFKSAAVMVLRQDRRLLTTADITKCDLTSLHVAAWSALPLSLLWHTNCLYGPGSDSKSLVPSSA